MDAKPVISHEIAVVAGPFAPGHLGELTRVVPFEMVDLPTAPASLGSEPSRSGSAIAPNAARDLLVQAAGVFGDTAVDLVGTTGRRVMAGLMPDRRIRARPRVVECAISKYNARGTVDRTGCKATISIDILTARTP